MQRIFFLLWMLTCSGSNLSAQNLQFGTWKDYQPDSTNLNEIPERILRIAFYVVRNDDGSGNFQEEEGKAYLLDLLRIANHNLANNQPLNLPVGNNIPNLPIRIQYVLTGDEENPDGIYFINDTENNHFNRKKGGSITDEKLYELYAKRKNEVLPIFIMENSDDDKANGGGIGMSNWVKMAACYFHFKERDHGAWFMAGLINHEVGHTLGLAHTWAGNDGCDDTPNHPNCWNVEPSGPCEVISNNMMDYNVYDNALSPCQIGLIHWRIMVIGSNSRNFLEPNWCNYNIDNTIYIDQNTVWNGARDLSGDIIIGRNAILTVNSLVSLPKGAQIIIRKKGKLIVETGQITNRCGEKWLGVKIPKRKKMEDYVRVSNSTNLTEIE